LANSETFPSSLFPLRGDISAESGATTVLVQGIQNIPVTTEPPADQSVLTFVGANGDIEWLPSGGRLDAIYVNGNPVSEDALILVNNNFILAGGYLGVLVNGTRII